MKFSVIIPSYDRAATLERAIRSVLAQSLAPQEVIVVDDASNDGTSAILNQYASDIKIITNPENSGVSFSRNAGIEVAGSEWIAFLDSDDEWHPEKLEKQMHFHEHHPELFISQCEEIWIRNGVRVNPMDKHAKQSGWIFEACLPLCIVSPSATIIHRGVFDHVGLFDVNLPACEDYDLWLRIAPHYEIGLLSEQLVTRYGGHADQLSRKYWGMDRFRITSMEKHLESKLKPSWKNALLKELEFKCGVVAQGARKRNNSEMATTYFEKQKIIRSWMTSKK